PGFGGSEQQWSLRTLEVIVSGISPSVRHVAYLDWHSLIEVSDRSFVYLCFNQPGAALFERCGRWWGHEAIALATVNSQWAGDRRFQEDAHPSRHGILMWHVQHLCAPRADVAGGVVEFCCDPEPKLDQLMARRLARESQWLYLSAKKNSRQSVLWRAKQKEAMCPARLSWREATVEMALGLYARTILGAAAWSAESVPAQVGNLCRYRGFDAEQSIAQIPTQGRLS
ncbi:MAG: hypothetical protein RL030_2532, partial [Pseudomonadota bacterium]